MTTRVSRGYVKLDRTLIQRIRHSRRIGVDQEQIIAAVTAVTGYALADLASPRRDRAVSYARHLAMFALFEHGRWGVGQIGNLLGNRDHSTVLGGIKRIELERTTRPETTADVANLARLLEDMLEDLT